MKESLRPASKDQSIKASEYWCVGEEDAEDVGKGKTQEGRAALSADCRAEPRNFP